MVAVMNPERAPNDLTGQQCGGSYKIVKLLGTGGMGQVWLARASELDDKEAAVKVLNNEALSRPEHLARFKAEVRVVGGFRDNNVVEVWDAGTLLDGRHYMIMEFCSGGSLASMLETKGTLSIEEAFMFIAGPASALAAAHAAKIVHRDVKPDNILLVHEDGRLRAKLGDFGIAKLNSDRADVQLLTGTMQMMGTPGFMAPEQINPKHGVDHRADIFSLGCVLYLCLTGKLPFPAGNVYEYIEAVMVDPRRPSSPRTLCPEIPLELDSLIMSCIEPDRERRIQTIAEVMRHFALAIPNGQALLQFFAPRFIDKTAAPTAVTISESVGVAASQFVSAISLSANQERRGAIRRTVVAFAAGALLSGGAVALASRPGSRPASPADVVVATIAPVAPPVVASPTMPALDATTPAPAAAMPARASATSSSIPISIALAPREATQLPTPPPPLDHAPTKPIPPHPIPSAPPRPADQSPTPNTTSRPPGDLAPSEVWLIIRIKGGFAEISIDGDKPSTSPRRKRVPAGVHHVVMTGYPDGSDAEKRKEFDVTAPAGKDETIIYKTW